MVLLFFSLVNEFILPSNFRRDFPKICTIPSAGIHHGSGSFWFNFQISPWLSIKSHGNFLKFPQSRGLNIDEVQLFWGGEKGMESYFDPARWFHHVGV